jgi:predicted nucleotidyltransferase
MFSAEEREALRERLLEWARGDGRITGAAVTGSGAAGRQDEWSDIDLYFGVDGTTPDDVLDGWTERVQRELDAIRLFDIRAGRAIYRVFLLPSGLEVDLAFAPADEFAGAAATFRAVFGTPVERQATTPEPAAQAAHLVGLCCHHALHARACIERGKLWQAEHVIHVTRDHVVELACLRHRLQSYFGREIDRLPADVTTPLEAALPTALAPDELRRALAATTVALRTELRHASPALAPRLEPLLP